MSMARCVLALAAGLLSLAASAQSLPPIYDEAPVQVASHKLVAEFPKNTFLENIALGANGAMYVTNYPEGKVVRIDASGKVTDWTKVDGKIAGIVLNPDGSAVLSGWIKGTEAAVFSVDRKGRSAVLAKLPGGQFPNGIIRVGPNRFFVADSYRGAIWEIDSTRKSARIWIEDETLARANNENPVPAVNGIKVFGDALYASNTQKQLLVRITLNQGKAGKPEVFMQNVSLDDFAFDSKGVLYGATHVYNSLIRIDRDRKITVLAGLEQGMAGSTAVGLAEDKGQVRLYVTTNGGMSLPPPGGVQSGKVVLLTVPRS